MNPQQAGKSYIDLVSRVMQMVNESTPGYQMSQSINNMQRQGIDPLSIQGMKDPQMTDAVMNLAMGATSSPEKLTPDMVKKLLSGKAVRTIRPDPSYLKQQMEDIINRVRAF